MSAAKITAQNLINENGVVVFSKSYCPYCKASKDLLNELGAKYTTLELDEERELPLFVRVYVYVVSFLPCCRMYIISENTSQYPKIPLHRIDRNFLPQLPRSVVIRTTISSHILPLFYTLYSKEQLLT